MIGSGLQVWLSSLGLLLRVVHTGPGNHGIDLDARVPNLLRSRDWSMSSTVTGCRDAYESRRITVWVSASVPTQETSAWISVTAS